MNLNGFPIIGSFDHKPLPEDERPVLVFGHPSQYVIRGVRCTCCGDIGGPGSSVSRSGVTVYGHPERICGRCEDWARNIFGHAKPPGTTPEPR